MKNFHSFIFISGRNGYLYGRGSSDNKGPLIVFLYAVREILDAYGEDLALDIVMIVEGQEEHDWKNGGLREVVSKNMDWLKNCQLILCSNSYWLDDEHPCLVYGMRGHVQLKVSVSGPEQDCHSGVHGGAFNEPLFDLMQILTRLRNPNTGRVMVPNFYHAVDSEIGDEMKIYDEIIETYDVQSYMQSLGYTISGSVLFLYFIFYICLKYFNYKTGTDDSGGKMKNLLLKRWRQPSLSVHKIQQSSLNSTVISKCVSAAISVRTVPKQQNENILRLLSSFVKNEFSKLNTLNKLKVEAEDIGDSWLMDYNNPIFKCAADAIESVWHKKPFFIREGGSMPATTFLHRKLNNATVLQFPMGQSTDRAHLENERIRLENVMKAKDVIKLLLRNICHCKQ